MNHINRRRALAYIGGAGALLMSERSSVETVDAATCVPATPTVTEGPYWIDEKLFRSDIRTDPATGVARPGVPLTLNITVQNTVNGVCVPLTGAYVDIWHCDAGGLYSDEPSYNPGGGSGTVVTSGQKFLRGYQITDDGGNVQFTTIYPGWYGGRTIHIHARIRTYSGSTLLDNFVTQLFFDDAVSDAVMSQAPYIRNSARDTRNSNDNVYATASNASRMLVTLTKTATGYESALTIGVTMKAAAAAAPAISSGGVLNAASGAAGVAPGSWISIYGSNLAAATRTLAAADVVNNTLPTSLGGVSVQINNKPAYIYYISPTQINLLSPADTGAGSVSVVVTNSAGTSSASLAVLQPVLPGLFTLSNFVRAVRWPDGAVIEGTVTAKAGDVVELYGTGFGPTTPSVDPSAVFTGAYPTNNAVTVTIAGVSAEVSWAGLVGPGLYQINVTVPAGLAAGDQAIIAAVAGLSTQSSARVKVGA